MTKTRAYFVTVSTTAVALVESEGVDRVVTIIPPLSPQMRFAIDEVGSSIAQAHAYKWPMMGTFPFEVPLAAGQFISAISDTAGMAEVSVVVKY